MSSSSRTAPSDGFSFKRLLVTLLPILAVALAVRYTLPSYEKAAQERLESDVLAKLLSQYDKPPTVTVDFGDEDGDLLCDPFEDDAAVSPESLVFSFVGAAEEVDETTTWADLLAALSDAAGVPVEYRHYPSVTAQLEALASGELHLAGLNTGAVPTAVELCGFHPVCTFGQADDSYGYTMQLIAPAVEGAPSGPGELAGKRVVFTQPNSNSGFKAALMYLMNEHDLLPERDYQWGVSFGHEDSIEEVLASGSGVAAPVASDILQRMIADGEVDADAFTVLYESERFPPVSLGYSHRLTADLRQKLGDALLAFPWPGTSVEAKYGSSGASQFVAINYKDDWANIRRIDEAIDAAKNR